MRALRIPAVAAQTGLAPGAEAARVGGVVRLGAESLVAAGRRAGAVHGIGGLRGRAGRVVELGELLVLRLRADLGVAFALVGHAVGALLLEGFAFEAAFSCGPVALAAAAKG